MDTSKCQGQQTQTQSHKQTLQPTGARRGRLCINTAFETAWAGGGSRCFVAEECHGRVEDTARGHGQNMRE